jgi:hypothetical protein
MVLCSLHFDRRAVAGDALPFSTGHLYPSISPALVGIDWLPIRVRPFADPVSGCDGSLASRHSRPKFLHVFFMGRRIV